MQQRILIIDDDSDDTSLFLEAVSEVKAQVAGYSAPGGPEALRLLQDGGIGVPDLIFLDINLPGMSGWDILRHLKKEEVLQHIPVIMYTTSSHKREVSTAFELGAIGFITKPHSYKELKNILSQVLSISGNDLPGKLREFCP